MQNTWFQRSVQSFQFVKAVKKVRKGSWPAARLHDLHNHDRPLKRPGFADGYLEENFGVDCLLHRQEGQRRRDRGRGAIHPEDIEDDIKAIVVDESYAEDLAVLDKALKAYEEAHLFFQQSEKT